MSGRSLVWAGLLTRGWVRLYTTGLPRVLARERRDEMASDLWEHARAAAEDGTSARMTGAQVVGRALRGMSADVAWHLATLRGDGLVSATRRGPTIAWGLVGILSVVMGAGLLAALAAGDWEANDSAGIVAGFGLTGVLAGVIGPFPALLGVYLLRRAQAEGLALGRARALMVTGTCGIALFGVAVWWTILGSLIALAILGYWSGKIIEWRAEPPSR